MSSSVLARAIKDSADPQRARHFVEQLGATSARVSLENLSSEAAGVLVALLSGSQAQANLLLANPDWLEALSPEVLKFPRRKQGLRNEIEGWLPRLIEARDFAGALRQLRQFKQREMFRIAARDLARLGTVSEITLEISDVADVCLATVWQICSLQLQERFGLPHHQDAEGQWHLTAGCILGLGKLGGQELNYSSDVDLMVLYEEEGSVFRGAASRAAVQPAAVLTNHQFFNRLTEAFVAEVTRMAPEGTLYRIDLRLRPEGDAGPLSRSQAGYENYYAQWGQTWERMMLIKARCVAGDQRLAAEFSEMAQPFRYPRSINESVLREIGEMKNRIETEVVKAGELERNVKLGSGGIREIEFIAQALQLLHAGRQPFLQGTQTLACLEKLAEYELLTAADSARLADAYRFLREIEHRLQMENNLQTHTIPSNHHSQQRLARLLGLANRRAFDQVHKEIRRDVQRIFDRLFRAETGASLKLSPFPAQFDGATDEWKEILRAHGFRDVEKAFRVLREFVEGPGYVHVSPRTSELALGLVPKLFGECGKPKAKGAKPARRNLSDPDRVVTRLDTFIGAYGARATLFELWHANPDIFELLVQLFDRSEFLAELAIRTPDLVDELVTSGRLRLRKSAQETLRDLRHGLLDKDQHLWLRQYHQAELMRIGLRDILGLSESEQYLTELSALADACLQYALEVVSRRYKLKRPPFVVIGLGKLGGMEIDYGSDLDILFVTGARAKNLSQLSRLAIELIDLVSRRTEQGLVFHTDARLRPDGEKGLLVNTLDACETYYRRRAQLWEIQALTRTRPIAGDLETGREFQTLTARLTNFKSPSLPLAAHTADWQKRIHQMRLRIEKERTPKGKDELAIKTGKGGLMDAEFIAQTLAMEQGWQEANTLRVLERGRSAHVVPQAERLIANYRQLRRVEGILRRWSYEGETVLPDQAAPYLRVALRCGFENARKLRTAIAGYRQVIRRAYNKVFDDA